MTRESGDDGADGMAPCIDLMPLPDGWLALELAVIDHEIASWIVGARQSFAEATEQVKERT